MSSRSARAIAGSICVLSLLAVGASIPVGLAARDRIQPGQIVVVGDPDAPRMQQTLRGLQQERREGNDLEATTANYNPVFGALVLLLLIWLGVGFLIVWRQPGNWAGWIFLITGAPFPLLTLGQSLVILGLKGDPGSVPLVGLWATLGEYALYPIALLPLLFLLYPDGHAPSRRWRGAVVGLVGGTAVALIGFLLRPGPYNNWIEDGILFENPFGIDALADVAPKIITVGTVLALVSALSTVVAVRQRFRRATGEERQQMRWLAFVASLAGVFFILQWVVGFIAEAFSPDKDAPIFELFLALTAFTIVLGVPAAYLVAIFRHGLWDLDVVIRKTVLYATVALLLVALFLVFAVVVGRALIEAEPGAIVASIAMGLLFWPAVRVARRVADRLVYGRRATPYEVLTDFSHRLGGSYASEDVLPRMAAILGEAVGASRAIVWLRVGREWRPVGLAPVEAEAPEPVGALGDRMPALPADAVVEVRDQGDLLGALTVSMPANDPMSPSKERLIRDLASQAGLVLRNVRLIEELRASRQRLVAAQDEERRRLERNIHDGAQQQLVALTVKLRLLEQLAGRDPAKVADMAAQLQAETTETLEDLRDLARGIYPPLLADQGLTAALEAQARKSALPVTVEATDVGRLSQDVEAAIYFSCLEALQNVAKYAEASRASISLTRSDGRLSFAVSDDGVGFDPDASTYGTGLQGIADRLDALGGRFEIRSAPGEGTTLVGLVPSPAGETG